MYGRAEGSVGLTRIDLAGLLEVERGPVLASAAAELEASVEFSEGPLGRIAYVDQGADRPGRLLLVLHHLVVDAVSWRILLEDLETACRQVAEGEGVRLPPPTTSFGQWARELGQYASSGALESEAGYWLSLPW